MKPRFLTSVLLAAFFLSAATANAQTVFQLDPSSKIWIEGTSNKSDWSVDATSFDGTFVMQNEISAADPAIEKVEVTVVSRAIKGDISTIMDRLLHDALKVSEHPEISYVLSSTAATQVDDTKFDLATKGRLTIGGVAKDIAMTVRGEKLAGDRVRFTGSHVMKMTEFDLKPPVALFGALRTGDEVTVHFDVVATRAAVN
jgi:hypothetical protein